MAASPYRPATDMTSPHAQRRILILGAGNIGCWFGGRLQAAGAEVHFVGRPRMLESLRTNGLTLTDIDGGRLQLPAAELRLHEAIPDGLDGPWLVLLCVKSRATAIAAGELRNKLPAGTLVLSMQNGISNAEVAQAAAPGLTVLPGMVPYNVAAIGPGCLHRGSDGQLSVQDHPDLPAWLPLMDAAGLPVALYDDLKPVQWGKLLLNLNNIVNALSGQPLRAQLLDNDLRTCTAALIDEALGLLARAKIKPMKLGPVSPRWLPWVLRLPTPLFKLAARRMLRIDEKARSSMADDLARNSPTEVNAINGEVLRLAGKLGVLAPVNARVVTLLKAWTPRSSPMSGRAMRKFLNV